MNSWRASSMHASYIRFPLLRYRNCRRGLYPDEARKSLAWRENDFYHAPAIPVLIRREARATIDN